MNRRPTLSDVAEIAGVSAKTVARVVNGEASVSQATRTKVEEAISALGYRANLSARALASAQALRVAIISPWISAYFVSQMYRGASQACRQRGYQLVINELSPSDSDALAEFAYSLREQPLDGVFIPAPLCDDPALLDLLDRENVRYVRHSPFTDPDRSDRVVADEEAGMELLVAHLWDRGHRRFGIVAGPDDHLASHLRCKGTLDAIARRGGDPSDVPIFPMHMRDTLDRQGAEAIAFFGSLPHRPSAVICFNDTVAAGALAQAQRQELSVPSDLAIAGYGDAEFTQLLWPSLTTLHQPNEAMAKTAMEWLTSPQPETVRTRTFPVRLITRSST